MVDLSAYARDPVAFIDRFIRRNELGQPFALLPHQREILAAAFKFDAAGRLPWDTILYSSPKKSGKTTVNAAVTLWWGFTQEAPNEVKLVANDLEQSTARVFTTIKGLLKHNPELGVSADVKATSITLSNGTTIDALANDFAGEAGANQGWSSWTELWAFTSEASRRLWEELTPVPTRRNSIRFIDTYAGFESESDLLFGLYKLAVSADEHLDGQGVRIHSSLPIFANRAARIFAYWDHEARMPWQTPAYYAAQRRTLRPNTFLRLHENRWTAGIERFIDGPLWDGCVDGSYRPDLSPSGVCLGVDAGIKHDTAAVVAVRRDGERVSLVAHRIWKPSAANPLDLEATIEAYLRELCSRMAVREILCDPYQLHRSITTLKAAGLPIREYPQTTGNTTQMGQALFDLLKSRQLRLYADEDLRQQALNAVAVESSRGWRIAKERSSRKVDAIVALAMACVSALDQSAHGPLELLFAGSSPSEVTRLQEEITRLKAGLRLGGQRVVTAARQVVSAVASAVGSTVARVRPAIRTPAEKEARRLEAVRLRLIRRERQNTIAAEALAQRDRDRQAKQERDDALAARLSGQRAILRGIKRAGAWFPMDD